MNKILILAANPRKDLDLRREIHILKSVIERSQFQDEFEVKIGFGISSDEIQRLFLEHKPRIIHFCGHGAGKQGLVFENDENAEQLVSNEALSDLFKYFANQVECVLLNACYSNIQATEISRHINYVIGMKQAIRDDAAIIFTRGFYQALAYGESIENSYKLGCNAIKIQSDNSYNYSSATSEDERKFINSKLISQSLPEHLKPQLKIKSPLTLFSNEDVSTFSEDSLNLIQLVQDEISRNRYRENIDNDFGLGRNNLHQIQTLTRQEYRWRQVLLSKVKEGWIKGVLEKSLFNQVLFEQTITNRPDAIQKHPFSQLEELSVESDKSFEFIQASDIFEGMGAGRTLLILGEPGTGKTLSLLKLAESLIKRIEQDLSLPIPVVFNLSSWGIKRKSISDWLVEELKDKYQVSKALGKKWIEQEELILLLDGLDEVKAEYRNDCVSALNKFLDKYGITEMAVCCRVQDYEALSERLKLRNAICIQPLSSEYINWYLEDVGKSLVGFKKLLQRDKELEKFAKTPLIFSVISITYKGYSLKELESEFKIEEKRYQKLFDNYIERMLQRKSITNKNNNKQIKKWLYWLSNRMIDNSNSIFLIEKMQPTWLNHTWQIILYRILDSIVIGFFLAMIFFGFPMLMFMLMLDGISYFYDTIINFDLYNLYELLLETLLSMIMIYLLVGWRISLVYFFIAIWRKPVIETVEKLSWSWKEVRRRRFQILYGMLAGIILSFFTRLIPSILGSLCIMGYSDNCMDPPQHYLPHDYLMGAILGCFFTLITIALKSPTINEWKTPNKGIWLSIKNSVIFIVVYTIFISVILSIYIKINNASLLLWSIWLIIGFYISFFLGFTWGGGKALFQHFLLRFLLFLSGYTPLNYVYFLNDATERLFLQKVGGGYIFIHRMLMEHFANMKLD